MGNKTRFWVLVVGLACLSAGLGVYWHHSRVQPEALPAPVAQAQVPVAPPEPNPSLLTLEQGEDLIRAKSAQLAAHAKLVEWLASEDFIRCFVSAVDAVAASKSPRRGLVFWRPRKKFSVVTKDDGLGLDPRSYARYNLAAEAFQSVDAQAAASLFKDLKPVFQAAYQELGYQNRDFEDTMIRAMQELLKTPVVEGRIRLNEKVISYSMADEHLEALSPAQKHLVRMGPKNTAKIQAKLRELAKALGVADDQLPAPTTYKAQ